MTTAWACSRLWLAACCAGLACPSPVRAQDDGAAFDLSLEQLRKVKVLTATNTATPYYDAPAVITLVTADDIARFGYLTVAEALSHKAGFIESDDRLNHNFGVRGISAGATSAGRGIKIMLDGQPVAFRSSQQQLIGYEFVPMSMIERIEIVRGPVSVLYGADALLGAVNIITRRDGVQQRLGAAYERGAAGRHNALLSGSGSMQFSAGADGGPGAMPAWLAWGVQAGREERGGLQLPRISPDYRRYAQAPFAASDQSEPLSVYLRGGLQAGASDLSASLFWQRQDSDNVFASLNPLLPVPSRVALSQGHARIGVAHRLTERQTLRASLGYSEGRPAGGDRVQTGAPGYYLLRDFGYRAAEASVEWLWQHGENASLLLGADMLHDHTRLESFRRHSVADSATDSADAASGDFQLSQPGQRALRNRAFYVQWQLPLTASWSAIAGGRRDRHSVYGSQPSYRAGVVGRLGGDWRLKLLTGTAFEAPSAELLYRTAVQPGDVRGNPALAPQKSRTAEVQLLLPPAPT